MLRLARNTHQGPAMHNCRSEGPISGEPARIAAMDEAAATSTIPNNGCNYARDGDVIRGLRSGLIFSLALWAMLFTFGALVFS